MDHIRLVRALFYLLVHRTSALTSLPVTRARFIFTCALVSLAQSVCGVHCSNLRTIPGSQTACLCTICLVAAHKTALPGHGESATRWTRSPNGASSFVALQTWTVLTRFDRCRLRRDIAVETLKGLFVLVIMERLLLTSDVSWIEDHVRPS